MRNTCICTTGLVLWSLAASAQSVTVVGAERVRGRLLARFAGDAESRAVQILSAHGARVDRRLPQTGVALIAVDESRLGSLRTSLKTSGLADFVEHDFIARPAALPNDPNYSGQWHLGTIQALKAWDLTGGAGVVVAVIDTGVDGSHPDLGGRLIPGWNFASDSSDTSDQHGHGTAVAGTIAASRDNWTGGVGVAPAASLLPVAVSDASGSASYSAVAAGIQYAADRGARIINISLGGSAASATLQSAVDYAWSKGSIVFAAAGNSASSTLNYPAACNRAVAVTATDSDDRLASFSNYGTWVTIAAPGVSILTTSRGGGYGYWSGTSLSAPVAAGVGALALAQKPSLSADALVQLLRDSAADLGAVGFDQSFGSGRVDASKAVVGAGVVAVTVSPVSAQVQAGGTLQLSAAVTGDANQAVTWSVTPAGVGSISGSGLYAAPVAVQTSQNVTIIATSVVDPAKNARATVTILPVVTVAVSPSSVTLTDGQTQQFNAAVSGSAISAVNWTLIAGPGTISPSGLYTAPSPIAAQTVATVVATSQADPSKSAAATISLVPGAPVVTPIPKWVTPGSPTMVAGSSLTLTYGLSGPAPAGMVIQVVITGQQAVSAPATLAVPAGSTTGSFSISALPVSSTATSYVVLNAGGGAALSAITVTPATSAPRSTGSLLWASISNASIHGGDTAGVMFQLSEPAPAGGTTVEISSSNPAVASAPATATVQPGMVIGVFFVPTKLVSAPTPVTITLQAGSSLKSVSLIVN